MRLATRRGQLQVPGGQVERVPRKAVGGFGQTIDLGNAPGIGIPLDSQFQHGFALFQVGPGSPGRLVGLFQDDQPIANIQFGRTDDVIYFFQSGLIHPVLTA